MMALVEDHAARRKAVVGPAGGRQRHHQRMVGHHDLGPPGSAHGPLDEAFVVMRAGGIDALAAPMRETERGPPSQQIGEPGGEVSAHHVAVPGRSGPARDEAEGDVAPGTGSAPAPQRFLQIQQAQIVVAAFADDDPAVLDIRVGMEAVEFAVDLALQIAGEGADPYRPAVFFRPQARRRDVAERLADARAGLGDYRVGAVLAIARREGRGERGGVVGLPRPVFRLGSQQTGEPAPGIRRFDGGAAGRRRGRALGDLRQAVPDPEAGGGADRIGAAEPVEDRSPPGPAGRRHE